MTVTRKILPEKHKKGKVSAKYLTPSNSSLKQILKTLVHHQKMISPNYFHPISIISELKYIILADTTRVQFSSDIAHLVEHTE